MEEIKKQPTLKDFQEYVLEMEKERDFINQTLLEKCLMLSEEVGELFKAIRKQEGVKIDNNSKFGSIEEELADIFIFICSIANKYNIDLEKSFRDKEVVNNKRTWE